MYTIYVRSKMFYIKEDGSEPEYNWSRWDLLESCPSEEVARKRLEDYRESTKRDAILREFKIVEE